MMKLVKVIMAKVCQHSPAKCGDFKKVGPKSLQLKESIFLSFLLTQSAEKFSMTVGEIEANFLTLSWYWLTNASRDSTNFGTDRLWMRRPKLFVSSILFVAVSFGP